MVKEQLDHRLAAVRFRRVEHGAVMADIITSDKTFLSGSAAYFEPTLKEELSAIAEFEFYFVTRLVLVDDWAPCGSSGGAEDGGGSREGKFDIHQGAMEKVDYSGDGDEKAPSASAWDEAGFEDFHPRPGARWQPQYHRLHQPTQQPPPRRLPRQPENPGINKANAGITLSGGIFIDAPKIEKTRTIPRVIDTKNPRCEFHLRPKSGSDATYFTYGILENSTMTLEVSAIAHSELELLRRTSPRQPQSQTQDRDPNTFVDSIMEFLNHNLLITLFEKEFEIGRESCATFEEKVNPSARKVWCKKELEEARERGVVGLEEVEKVKAEDTGKKSVAGRGVEISELH
ncbi:hypothetical protein EX30DRAFT_349849 [Ascodesmis nigricans]|uniref:Uncharacterized protein n=1 Tax=Ascodesmis nigricans TaxID=341454 RepID=A0A4S2MTQ7_9PEZI|nr:hypothetical protein EX30DRAFT_349849 [Ascodesmis nigricans]